jgi:hypothetical protein
MVSSFPYLSLVYCLYEEQTPNPPPDHHKLKSKDLISEENRGDGTVPFAGRNCVTTGMDLCMDMQQYTTLLTDHSTTIMIM